MGRFLIRKRNFSCASAVLGRVTGVSAADRRANIGKTPPVLANAWGSGILAATARSLDAALRPKQHELRHAAGNQTRTMSAVATDDRGLIVNCPHCGQANRVPYARLNQRPSCAKCHEELPPATEPINIEDESV